MSCGSSGQMPGVRNFSYVKFWQMIGRGSRVLDPNKIRPWCLEKDKFLIIDCWGNLADVREIPVPVPPLSEQRRIAAILDKADAIRRKRREALRRTDQFLRSAFLDMFGDPVSNRKGFPRVKLSDLAAEDGIRCGPFGTQLCKSEYRSNGVPLWGITHVDAHFRLPTDEFLEAAKAGLLDQYSLEPGDIVMTRKGTIGNCAVYPSDFAPGVMHSDLQRIRVDTTRSLPICLTSQLTLSRDVERQIAQFSHGANRRRCRQPDGAADRCRPPPGPARFPGWAGPHTAANQHGALRDAPNLMDCLVIGAGLEAAALAGIGLHLAQAPGDLAPAVGHRHDLAVGDAHELAGVWRLRISSGLRVDPLG